MDVEALAIACGGVLVKSIRNAIWGYVFKMSILTQLLTEIEKALLGGDFPPEGFCPPSQIIPRLQRIADKLKADNLAKSLISAPVPTQATSAPAPTQATSAPVPTQATSAPAPTQATSAPAPTRAPTTLEMLSSSFKNNDPDVFAEGQNAFSVIASSKSNPEPQTNHQT